MNQVIAYKVDSLTNLKPNSIVALKVAGVSKFELFITDLQGAPHSLNLPATTGVQQIINTDGALQVVGSTNVVINLEPAILASINSALQVGDNISNLLNDAGYITSLDLPTKTSDLINDGEDGTSFYIEDTDVRLSDARTPLSHTHTESDITDLDKYTQTETDNLLLTKEDLINKSTAFETDKTSDDKYPSVKSVDEIIVKKSFSQPLDYSDTGSNVIIPLPPTGNEKFYFVNDLLTSLSGFNLSLITGNPTAEIPFNGKEIIVFNGTANPITINHNAVADIPYLIKDAADLVVPSGELVRFMYEGGVMKELFRSWSSAVASDETETYTFVVTSASAFPAYIGWYSPRDNVANGIFNPLWEIGLYDGTGGVMRTRMGRRIVKYNQKATEIAISYSTVTVATKIRFIYYEINPSGTSIVGINNHTIHEVTIPANTGSSAGVVQSTMFITPADFTMLKGGMISMVIDNNNLALTFKDFIAEVRVKKI